MALKRCRRCTAPIYLRLNAVWNDNGTITGRFAKHTRVVQIYSDEINHIISGISKRIGFDISRIVMEGERKAGSYFTSEARGRRRGLSSFLVSNRLLEKYIFKFMLNAVKNAGLGNCRLVGYKRRQSMTIELEKPFNIPILAGDFLGAFEAFYSVPGEVSWDGDSSFVRISVKAGSAQDHVEEERLMPVLPPTLPGKVELDRCPKCRIPLEVTGRYQFDLDEGIATEVTTGRRIVTIIIDSINAIFRELKDELGDEVARMIVELESDFVMKNAPPLAGAFNEDAMRELLSELKVKGMGNPVEISYSGDRRLRVRVDNPFSEELLAGRVLGFYRACASEQADVEWTSDTEGFMVIDVSASVGGQTEGGE